MPGPVKPIPDQYRGATPYIICKGAANAIEFYQKAFGAVETFRLAAPNGQIRHSEIRIGKDAIVMLADECLEMVARSPQTIGGSPVSIYIYVEDVDALARRAEAAGATIKRPVGDQFYGDRSVNLEDPFGHSWGFATHKEDLSFDEIKKRAAVAFGG